MKKRLMAVYVGNKTRVILAGILLVGLLLSTVVYMVAVYPQSKTAIPLGEIVPNGPRIATEPIENGQTFSQDFSWAQPLRGLRVYPGTHGTIIQQLTLTGRLYDSETNEILLEFSNVFVDVEDDSRLEILFETPIQTSGGLYRLEVQPQGIAESEMLSFFLREGVEPFVLSDGVPSTGALQLAFYGTAGFATLYFWLFALTLCVLAALLWYLLYVKKWAVPKVYLVAALGFGLLYMFAYPPYAESDSVVHTPTSHYYAGRLLGQPAAANGTFEMRVDDGMDGYSNYPPRLENYGHTFHHFFETEQASQETITTEVQQLGQPYQYFPQAMGLALGQALKLGQVPTLHLGYLFSLLCYVGITYLAVRLSPFQTLFSLLGLTPFALQVAGTVSYDTLITALGLLFVAQVLRLCHGIKRMTVLDLAALALVGLLLAPLKLAYIPMLLLPLMIPKEKWPRAGIKTIFAIALLLVGSLGLITYAYYFVSSGALQSGELVGQTPWAQRDVEGGYTYAGLLQTPLVGMRLILFSIVGLLDEIIMSVGYFQPNPLPIWLCLVYWLVLFLTVSPKKDDSPLLLKPYQRSVLWGSGFLVYLLVLVAAIPWTFIGSYFINGVQGRYFMPILALVILPFYGLYRRAWLSEKNLLSAGILVNVYTVMSLLLQGFLNRPWPRF